MKENKAPKRKFVFPDKLYARCKDNKTIDMSYAPQNMEAVEYTCTDAFMKKAREWFERQYEWYDKIGVRHCDMKSFEDFKEYMEGEKGMKARDLMIGDLVIDTEFEERNKINVVECIEPSRVWLRNGKLYTPIEFIKPIPLTKEILEKNGFEEGIGCDYCLVFNMDENKYILYNFKDSFVYIRNGFYNIELQIQHVHQLQHALRLCGIKKEIIL